MKPEDRQRLNEAILAVSNPSHPLYRNMQALIQKHSDGFVLIHTPQYFLPWHRNYQIEIEDLLQRVYCDITLPYWSYSEHPINAFSYYPFTLDGLGGNGTGIDGCVGTGPFAFPWIPAGKTSCLTRSFSSPSSVPTYMQLNNIMKAQNYYVSFSNSIQINYHNTLHATIAGDQSTKLSPNDPVFFLLHSNVDRIWNLWQSMSEQNMNAYNYTFPNNIMPYTLKSVTPSDVNSLEELGIRYVYSRSSDLNKNNSKSSKLPSCSYVKLDNGWFSIDKIEKAIINTQSKNLYNIKQNMPVVVLSDQQSGFIQIFPESMRDNLKIILKNAETEIENLAAKLTNISYSEMFMGMDLNEVVKVLNITVECNINSTSCGYDNGNTFMRSLKLKRRKIVQPQFIFSG